MKKPTLGIESSLLTNSMSTLGMSELCRYLTESELFNVYVHDEPPVSCSKSFRATTIHVDNKRIYLDMWEYPSPTYNPAIVNANFDLIIKLQHKDKPFLFWEGTCQKRNILLEVSAEERAHFFDIIIPWTFFGSKLLFFRSQEELDKDVEIEHLAFFGGKNWRGRHGMKIALERQGLEFIDSDIALRRFKSGKVPDDQYLQLMKSSKYGLVISGRGSIMTEAKNRREIDYLCLGKPVIMNYRPFYYNPLVEGEHYIYINEDTDISDLENHHDIEKIAKNGHEWYKQNASPSGAVRSFFKIMKEKLNLDYSDLVNTLNDDIYNKKIKDAFISKKMYNNQIDMNSTQEEVVPIIIDTTITERETWTITKNKE